jgi:formylglycine-generating enzyme required for sulfatase activity
MKITVQILIATLMLAVSNLWAQAPMVSDISYSQRLDQDGNRTKLVDIQYNLDGNRSMFVEFFFSHDGGVTFPVTCTAVTGDAGPFVQYGIGKTAVWDAAQDWDQQFTSQGRIMIKATYGDQPTGFPGLGQDGNQSNGGPVAMETVAIPFPAVAGPKYGPSWALREIYQQELIVPGKINAYPQQFHVDKFEVTKGAWNTVAQWGRANGYSDLMDVSNVPDLNSADLGFGGFENVVKWLNARSEMEGLVPVFYLELSERGHDVNGDGNISLGPDSQYPTSEDYADPNFQDPYQDLNFDPDPNGNYQWDPGEYFVDRNGDGVFQPNEFDDWNGNGIQDMGLSTVYRVGSIMQQPPVNQQTGYADFPWDLFLHTKFSANGYRLPDAYIAEAEYFAMGGRTEQSTMDPFSNEVIYATEWPWGGTEENPSEIHAVVPPNSMNPDFLVGFKAPNGDGLYDMIGNTAELSLGVSNWGAGSALYVPSYGGSAQQAPSTEIDPMTGMMGTAGPALWMTPNSLAPTGFRAMRLEF